MPANLLTMLHVFEGEFLGGGESQYLLLLDGFAPAHRGPDLVHRIDGIDRGGSGGLQGAINSFVMSRKFLEVASSERANSLGQAVSRGGAYRAGTPHDHVMDRGGGLAKITASDNGEFVGQQPLFNQQDSIALGVKG